MTPPGAMPTVLRGHGRAAEELLGIAAGGCLVLNGYATPMPTQSRGHGTRRNWVNDGERARPVLY